MLIRSNHKPAFRLTVWLAAVSLLVMPIGALAQTKISFHSNKFSPQDDVKLGRQAAAEVERQMPILHNQEVTDYVAEVGRRLAAAIPPEFQHPEFHFSFQVVDASDINAFALPGGPMFVNRGMIQAARNEGEMAGVMAHEMSHVALRHGTAQATKAQKYQYGAVAGAILGSIIGGGLGSVVGQGSQMAVGTYFLRYSREYEKEADILGSHIMARAGYDPRDLANMFRTIEQQGGGGGPQFLSDHPNPGNRYQYITQEAQYLQVSANPTKITPEFMRVKEILGGMPRARSSAQIAQSGQRYPSGGDYPRNGGGQISRNVSYPSSSFRTYTEGNLFRVSVPSNWNELQSNDSVTFAPSGAYDSQGQITHGVILGVANTQGRDLQQASDEYINALAQSNPNMRQRSVYQRTSLGGRDALTTSFSNVSEITGASEIVTIVTTQLENGNLFYMVAVAPQQDYRNYQPAFSSVMRSIQLNG